MLPTTTNSKDLYPVIVSHHLIDDRTHVLKHGDTFVIFDRYGDIQQSLKGQLGFFYEGTKYLNQLELMIYNEKPFLLNSDINDNSIYTTHLTNGDIFVDNKISLAKDTFHIARFSFIDKGICHQRIKIKNYSTKSRSFDFKFLFNADFLDLFEVRGMTREKRGEFSRPIVEGNSVIYSYKGLDDIVRETKIIFSRKPTSMDENEAFYEMNFESKQEEIFDIAVVCNVKDHKDLELNFDLAFDKKNQSIKELEEEKCLMLSSNEQFNDWILRSQDDLYMMITKTEHGLYPYAGVPWYNTPFGRDGIITALEALWFYPELSKGVLSYLSKTQAKVVDPERDAEPGKILHETRKGEMANTKEIPFSMYYGTIDATPLYLFLAGEYYVRTGDLEFIRSIWTEIELALNWLDDYGDVDNDGFVEYQRQNEDGLLNQGWKDSGDSMFHKDGEFPNGPIALSEVQSYVYGAKNSISMIAEALGKKELATKLKVEADKLKKDFNEKFWNDEIKTYVIALDGKKEQLEVGSSNAGHTMFTKIADQDKAETMSEELFSKEYFSGWGIRTIPENEIRYNPMSYHNGSIWPHDNALIAYGLSKYGLSDKSEKLLTAFFDTSIFFQQNRLPELFCGFPRSENCGGPTEYPVACLPQSWAAASVFLFLQSSLGLRIDGVNNAIIFSYPRLPASINNLKITNLRVNEATIDLEIIRSGSEVLINALQKQGLIELIIIK